MSFFANAKSALLSGSTTTTTNDESSTQLNPTNNQPSGATATLNNAIPQIPPQLGQGGTFGSAQRTSSARFTAGTAPNQSGFSFGGAATTASTGNVFNNSSQTAQTTSPSRGFGTGFGGASTNTFSGFGQPSTGGFGQATTTSFGQPAQTPSGFGQPSGGFGQAPRTNTTASAGTFRGRPATSGFGQATTTPFGQPAQTTTTFGQPTQPSYTQPAQTTARGFGQPSTTFGGVSTTSPLTTQAGGFGQTATTGTFGQATQAGGFGLAATTGTFGQSAQATGGFGQPATSGFGQTTQFGRFGQTATTGTFGQATQAGGFGQAATTNTFGQGTQATGRMSQVTPNNPGQPQSEFPGTIGHMGRVHVYADTARNWAVASITGAIRDQGLEELRVRDYWALKRKTINQEKITQIENVLQQNINARNSGFIPPPLNTVPPNQHVAPLRLPQNTGGTFGNSANPGFSGGNQAQTQIAPTGTAFGTSSVGGGVFSSTGLASTISMQSTTQPFGASANPFNNAQATTSAFGTGDIKSTPAGSFGNTNPLPMQKFGASVAKNPSEKAEEKPKSAPIFGQKPLTKFGSTDEEPSAKKNEKTMSHPRTVLSKPEEHNLSPPEGLLDETDFAPRLFEFLEDFSIKPPTETVPRFKITTTQQGMLHSTPIKSERRKKHTTKAQSKENEAAKIPSGKKEVIEESSDEDSEDSEEEKVEIVPKKQTIVEEEKKIEEKEEKEEKKEISEDNETKKEIIGQEEQISQQIPTSEVSTTEGTSVNQSTTEQNEVKEPSSAEEVISTTF